jgi:hypothetical protein
MPDRTLAIVFRNPHPQRSPVRTKLYLLRSDGGSLHIDYPHQGSIDPNRAGPHASSDLRGAVIATSSCQTNGMQCNHRPIESCPGTNRRQARSRRTAGLEAHDSTEQNRWLGITRTHYQQ